MGNENQTDTQAKAAGFSPESMLQESAVERLLKIILLRSIQQKIPELFRSDAFKILQPDERQDFFVEVIHGTQSGQKDSAHQIDAVSNETTIYVSTLAELLAVTISYNKSKAKTGETENLIVTVVALLESLIEEMLGGHGSLECVQKKLRSVSFEVRMHNRARELFEKLFYADHLLLLKSLVDFFNNPNLQTYSEYLYEVLCDLTSNFEEWSPNIGMYELQQLRIETEAKGIPKEQIYQQVKERAETILAEEQSKIIDKSDSLEPSS